MIDTDLVRWLREIHDRQERLALGGYDVSVYEPDAKRFVDDTARATADRIEAERITLNDHLAYDDSTTPGKLGTLRCLTCVDTNDPCYGFDGGWTMQTYPCRTIRAIAWGWRRQPGYEHQLRQAVGLEEHESSS